MSLQTVTLMVWWYGAHPESERLLLDFDSGREFFCLLEPHCYILHLILGCINLLAVWSEVWGTCFTQRRWISLWTVTFMIQWYDVHPECRSLGFDSQLRHRVFLSVETHLLHLWPCFSCDLKYTDKAGCIVVHFSIVIKYLLLDYEMFVFMIHQFTAVFGTDQIVGFL